MPLSKAEIARVRALREKKHREAEGLYVVEGAAHCREYDESLGVDIGGVTFYVVPAIFAALRDGQRYRIYYVEHRFAHWRRPVSAETLR